MSIIYRSNYFFCYFLFLFPPPSLSLSLPLPPSLFLQVTLVQYTGQLLRSSIVVAINSLPTYTVLVWSCTRWSPIVSHFRIFLLLLSLLLYLYDEKGLTSLQILNHSSVPSLKSERITVLFLCTDHLTIMMLFCLQVHFVGAKRQALTPCNPAGLEFPPPVPLSALLGESGGGRWIRSHRQLRPRHARL